MTTTLKHLKPQGIRPSAKMLDSLAIAPTMQAIIINCVAIIDPQLAPIIRDDTESVVASPSDFQCSCPAHSKVITSGKTSPFPIRVAVVHHLNFAGHVWSASTQVLAPTSLPEIVDLLLESSATRAARATCCASSTRAHDDPSVSSIRTVVPEQHASMTTALKELKPHKAPSGTNIPSRNSLPPAMQAIIINRVPVVNPKLAPII
jgi:hypothetical protein